MTIKQDLRSVNKDIKALSKKVDGLLKTVEKSEAAKQKPAKSEPAKRAPAKKKTAGVTATDQVLRLINKRTKKGITISSHYFLKDFLNFRIVDN